mgnify:CR=1 FL=1
MTLAEIDAQLSRLEASAAELAADLMDLEANATYKLLDPVLLSGTTLERAAGTRATADSLWAKSTSCKHLVNQARDLRGHGNHLPPARVAELEALLDAPARQLADAKVELAAVNSTVAAIDDVWRTMLSRLTACQEQLSRLASVAAAVGEPVTALDRTRRRVDDLAKAVASDPLSADPSQFAEIEATLATVGTRLDELAHDRETLDDDLRAGAITIQEITAALDAGEAALVESNAKIARARGLLAPLDRGCVIDPERGLEPWLGRLRELAAQGEWRMACRGLGQWQRVAADTLVAARRVAEANTAPVRQRNELRGRLDAFAAKAERLALTEDVTASTLRERARAELYTAPTDLDAAADLVARYGASLTRPER